ncbi:MAG: diphthamide biosynthesis enzyme Dph2 [Candidatus Thermoplasmatota archaeon]|nr:diphthamide biosynthesis enzyme Dph2 [Euryarchaeota archaeon]MBU4031819.1 diphthamide biosynthesis enzyme Dph2 [Candidatus Thermoplasmatota archaeon]MBU4072065.1 diphthamide biosynthesis enzyme Dph2 [Candidatus Thermoplasmatota archaeon]MBU4144584.1 diphthamide biosynthesis enzyme Dph2 [Candidatus Thermoplasmatota archaeon]MBU4592133.1 diphthamide biosynthesis enzyme Dph2 [Candidatus Thermoplasmatota archaeon]
MQEDFDFEIEKVISTVRDKGCRKVLLQFPEGMKRRAPEIAMAIADRVSAIVIISGDPCFGACDIPDTDADLIVNYGHLPIPNLSTPKSVLYIQLRSSADPFPVLEKVLPKLGGRIGLLTTAQHLHVLGDMVIFLRSKGIEVLVGKGDSRLYAEGQVLGCNASCARAVSDRVDSFLFVGTGNFHALAVSLVTSKPVIVADPVSGEISDISSVRDRMLRQRHGVIEKAREAGRFGIILSSKQGQRREILAHRISEMLTDAGLESVMVELNMVTPGKLENLGLDAWVSTACPRLAIDDYAVFPRPVLTPPEVEILLGKRHWDNYIFDEIM